MRAILTKNWIPSLILCLFVFLIFILSGESIPIQASFLFQSVLPEPPPNFIVAAHGGRRYCGLHQSSVWVDVPANFTSQDGAEFHCDPTISLSEWGSVKNAWDDRGYLIGFWSSDIPITKPFYLVFEIDPARSSNICSDCFLGRVYVPGSGWKSLPTAYQVSNARVYVTISAYLARSEYPGYEDRFMIALFRIDPAAPTPTATPTSELTRAITPTSQLTPTATATPLPASTLSPTNTPLPSSTPTLQTPTPSASEITPTGKDDSGGQDLPIILLVIVIIMLVLLVIILFALYIRTKS